MLQKSYKVINEAISSLAWSKALNAVQKLHRKRSMRLTADRRCISFKDDNIVRVVLERDMETG